MADYVEPSDVPGPVLELVQQLEFGFAKGIVMYKVLVSFADS